MPHDLSFWRLGSRPHVPPFSPCLPVKSHPKPISSKAAATSIIASKNVPKNVSKYTHSTIFYKNNLLAEKKQGEKSDLNNYISWYKIFIYEGSLIYQTPSKENTCIALLK